MLNMLKLKSPENARLKFVLVNSVWNGVKVVCAVFRQVLEQPQPGPKWFNFVIKCFNLKC